MGQHWHKVHFCLSSPTLRTLKVCISLAKKKNVSFLGKKKNCVTACFVFYHFQRVRVSNKNYRSFWYCWKDSEGNLMLKPRILFQNSEENFSLQEFEWLCLAQCGESTSADYRAALSHPFLNRIGGKSKKKKFVDWDKDEDMTCQLPSETDWSWRKLA